ncbi:Hypothetical protein CINCED_3A009795 [Cinara cedri]|uniref:Uncharacterized protein n=1 Tax=Cinara cedri TaxID=506608 RepID=A0A5E4N5M2_9HEMI|nr:Hypothetical protein CINCED_3A009795 [Cinara cedri]
MSVFLTVVNDPLLIVLRSTINLKTCRRSTNYSPSARFDNRLVYSDRSRESSSSDYGGHVRHRARLYQISISEWPQVFKVENVLPLRCNVIDEEQFKRRCCRRNKVWYQVHGSIKQKFSCSSRVQVFQEGCRRIYEGLWRWLIYYYYMTDEKKYKHLNIRIMALCLSLISTLSSAAVAHQNEISSQRLNVFPDKSREAVMRKRPIAKKIGKTGERWSVKNNEEPPKLVEVPNNIIPLYL